MDWAWSGKDAHPDGAWNTSSADAAHTRSMAMAVASPPPMHKLAIPRFLS